MGLTNKVAMSIAIGSKRVVAAALPVQEHRLPLSNLDLLLPPVEFGVFLCYKREANTSFSSAVGSLKRAMAYALELYYAFAGEVVYNSMGEPEILCNNRGVDFIEAYANIELRDLDFYNADESVEKKLVAKKASGNSLSVQVTEFQCGGVVVGCSFDHRVADSYSANMFLLSWAEAARSDHISGVPSFQRSFLSPRRPGHYDASIDDIVVPISKLPPPPFQQPINRIYYVAAKDIDGIQALSGGTRTKLESFSAYIWQAVARCSGPDAKTCSMGVVVDGRSRLGGVAPMGAYFGNVLSIPYGTMEVKILKGMGLGEVAEAVHEFVRAADSEEHFLGLVDWVEAHRPKPAVAKLNAMSEGMAFMVSSGRRFPVSEVDFGWGPPVFGSYYFPLRGVNTGYVMPMPSPSGNGDWVVYVCMKKGLLESLEEQEAHTLRPLTATYLGLE